MEDLFDISTLVEGDASRIKFGKVTSYISHVTDIYIIAISVERENNENYVY